MARPLFVGLTSQQSRVLDYVLDYCERHGYPPCIREITTGTFKASTSSTHRMLHLLAERGFLARREGVRSRSFYPAGATMAQPIERRRDGAVITVRVSSALLQEIEAFGRPRGLSPAAVLIEAADRLLKTAREPA